MAEMINQQQLDHLVDEVLETLLEQLSKSITEEILQRWPLTAVHASNHPVICEQQHSATARIEKKLITENDAAKFHKVFPTATTVAVSKKSIVTPLAMDFFRNRQIKLLYQ